MKKHLIMNQLFVDKNSHRGAKVLWHYIYLPEHDELYFVKEIKQAFKVLLATLHVTTSLKTFKVPSEISPLFDLLNNTMLEEFEKFNLQDYRANMLTNFNDAYSLFYKGLDNADMAIEEKDMFKQRAINTNRAMATMFSAFSDDDNKAIKPFTDCGYEPLFKINNGTERTLYIGKMIYDRLSVYKMDIMSVKGVEHLVDVETFSFTKELITHFTNRVNKHKGRSDVQ